MRYNLHTNLYLLSKLHICGSYSEMHLKIYFTPNINISHQYPHNVKKLLFIRILKYTNLNLPYLSSVFSRLISNSLDTSAKKWKLSFHLRFAGSLCPVLFLADLVCLPFIGVETPLRRFQKGSRERMFRRLNAIVYTPRCRH